jgi:hypothetical protein
MYNVILWCVHITIIAMEMQQSILSSSIIAHKQHNFQREKKTSVCNVKLSQHRLYVTEMRDPDISVAHWKNIQTIHKKGFYQINILYHSLRVKTPITMIVTIISCWNLSVLHDGKVTIWYEKCKAHLTWHVHSSSIIHKQRRQVEHLKIMLDIGHKILSHFT